MIQSCWLVPRIHCFKAKLGWVHLGRPDYLFVSHLPVPHACCTQFRRSCCCPSPSTDNFRRLVKLQPEYEEQDNIFSLKKTITLWWKSTNFASTSPISLLTPWSFWSKLLCRRKCCRNQQGNCTCLLPYKTGYERTKAAYRSFLWGSQRFPWDFFLFHRSTRSRNIDWPSFSLSKTSHTLYINNFRQISVPILLRKISSFSKQDSFKHWFGEVICLLQNHFKRLHPWGQGRKKKK